MPLSAKESKEFKEEIDRLKSAHERLRELTAKMYQGPDMTLSYLGIARLNETIKCFELIALPE